MKTMSIESMRKALAGRNISEASEVTGVKERTLQSIISGQSTNPTYNVFKAVQEYLHDDRYALLSAMDRRMLTAEQQSQQIETNKKAIKINIIQALTAKPTKSEAQLRLLILYASGNGDYSYFYGERALAELVEIGEVEKTGDYSYQIKKD